MVLSPDDNVNESVLSVSSKLGSTVNDSVFPPLAKLYQGCVPDEIFHASLEVTVNTLVPPSASKLAEVDEMVNTLSIFGLGCPFNAKGLMTSNKAVSDRKSFREIIDEFRILQSYRF